MPSLVEQLQLEAIDQNISILDILRKAKVVAMKLKQHTLSEWMEKEISGYEAGDVPNYRKIPCELKYKSAADYNWYPCVGYERTIDNRQPLHEIVNLISSGSNSYIIPLPPDLYIAMSKQISRAMDIKLFPYPQQIAGIVESVRNTILDWSLKLWEAGVHGEGVCFLDDDYRHAKNITNINIGSIGSATSIGITGDNTEIASDKFVNEQKFLADVHLLIEKLDKLMPTSDIPENSRKEANRILEDLKTFSNPSDSDTSRIRSCLTSLKTIMENAVGSLVASGVVHIISTLTK